MNFIQKIFLLGFAAITTLFVVCAFSLIVLAVYELWGALNPASGSTLWNRFNAILETIGLLTISVASLELGQTILEEEVRRQSEISVPTRARRFLSRFILVVIVSLAIEFLVAVFQLLHGDISLLPAAAMIGFATAALLIGWGAFIRFNKSVEELEPEAIERVKDEDDELR